MIGQSIKHHWFASRGIIPDYLSIPRKRLGNIHIRFTESCDNYFNISGAFACASDTHFGNDKDLFERFNYYWQQIRNN